MHATGVWLAEDNAGLAVAGQTFELGAAFFPLGRHAAHSNFVADHFDGFAAYDIVTREYPKDCILSRLSISFSQSRPH